MGKPMRQSKVWSTILSQRNKRYYDVTRQTSMDVFNHVQGMVQGHLALQIRWRILEPVDRYKKETILKELYDE